MNQLICKNHHQPIIFIETTNENQQTSRLMCQDCDKVTKGCPCINIQNFNLMFQEKQKEILKEQQNILAQFLQFSNPLHKLLDNYLEEINSTIKIIYQELNNISNDIHEYYKPIINYDPQLITHSDLEKTTNFIYSTREQYNLKSKYFEFIKVIKILIGLQNHYCQIMKKCFEPIQDDLANYKSLQNFHVSNSKICNAIAIRQNKDDYLLALALENKLQTYEYQYQSNQKELKLKQTLQHHEHNITCAIFSEDNKFLISGGSYDKKMNIYRESQNKNFYDLIAQVIHQDHINSIIFTPNNEDLISASGNHLYLILSNDQISKILINNTTQTQIKPINFKDIKNETLLLSAHENTVYQLSYFFIENLKQFLSCSFDKQVCIWQKQNASWVVFNKIKLQHHIYRCCFISENEIVIQENSTKELVFYDNVSKKNEFQKSLIKSFSFEDINFDTSSNFPMVYIQQLKLLVVKHNKIIVFLKQRKNGRFYLENKKDGEMGAISPNGQIFLKWSKKQSSLEMYKLNSHIERNKEEFEKKYLITQLNQYQSFDNQKQFDQKDLEQTNKSNLNKDFNIQKSSNINQSESNKNNKDIQDIQDINNESGEQNQKDKIQNEKKIKIYEQNTIKDDLSYLVKIKD